MDGLSAMLGLAEFFFVAGMKLYCEEKLIEKLVSCCPDDPVVPKLLYKADRYQLEVLREISLNMASGRIGRLHQTKGHKHLSLSLWSEILETIDKRFRTVSSFPKCQRAWPRHKKECKTLDEKKKAEMVSEVTLTLPVIARSTGSRGLI